MTVMIEARGVHKRYRMGSTEVHALRGVDIDVAEGECVFLGGPSGSGKSTLLHLLGGLDRASEGSVKIHGFEVAAPFGKSKDAELADFRCRHIGFVFQSFNLLPVLTAAENVDYPLMLAGVSDRPRRVARMLEEVGLAELARRYPNELSGGQRQRVAIARALVHQPALLIADEPTANLDTHTGERVIDLILALSRKQGSSVVICTHDPALLARAPRLVRLRDGKVESDERYESEDGAQAAIGNGARDMKEALCSS